MLENIKFEGSNGFPRLPREIEFQIALQTAQNYGDIYSLSEVRTQNPNGRVLVIDNLKRVNNIDYEKISDPKDPLDILVEYGDGGINLFPGTQARYENFSKAEEIIILSSIYIPRASGCSLGQLTDIHRRYILGENALVL